MITIFVGDNTKYLATDSLSFDSSSFLVDSSNYRDFLDNFTQGTVYTSLADLPHASYNETPVLYDILLKADEIIYNEPAEWSDKNEKLNYIFGQKYYTETILTIVDRINHNVKNLNTTSDNKYTTLADTRKDDSKQLWITGCSITYGTGVDVTERYGHILEKELNVNTTILARAGMSIEWDADQLLRSDIRKGDTIFWALPIETRNPVWDSDLEELRNNYSFKDSETETIIYRSITNILKVVNICKKLGINLVLWPINPADRIISMISHLEELFITPIQKEFLDIGTDGVHPGPIQHAVWAKLFINELKARGYY